MEGGFRPVAVALVLLAGFIVVGYASISSSGYMSVSDLAALDSKAKVTVQGAVQPLGRGEALLILGGEEYEIEAMGSYGVAREDDGRVIAIFIIGDGANKVLAVYDATREYAVYMAGNALSSEVVVAGTYDPQAKALIQLPDGTTAEYPVIRIDTILKGCHESYSRGTAWAS